tara:strand:- start:75 stop:731 length:657 start_codon:yes stop_codon:yes gene_type:complete
MSILKKTNKKKLIILGGHGVGLIVASIAKSFYNYKILGFLNDKIKINSKIGINKKYKIIGKSKDVKKYLKDDEIYFFNAIIDYKKKNSFKIKIPNKKLVSFIHPKASYDPDTVKISKNVLICSNSTLSTDVSVGEGVKIMSNVFVGHNTMLKKNVFIAAGAVIGGTVTINTGAFIGLNSTIIENLKVGKNSILGAGSVLTKNIKNKQIFFGNPAKKYK